MLEKLIERILQGGGFSTQSLSLEFGVSNELVQAMLGDLVRAGYLRLMDGCDHKNCNKCGVAVSCEPRGKTWVLVDRALNNPTIHSK